MLVFLRINLDSKKAISFDEFFSKFRVAANIEKDWLCPIKRRDDTHTLPWQYAYSQLQAKAKEKYVGMLFLGTLPDL